MLKLARAGTAGTEKGTLPVLDDDGVRVATLRTAKVREAATAVVGDREWAFERDGRALRGRWSVDPAGTARLTANPLSRWKGTWEVDLEGVRLQMGTLSVWRGTHRYEREGRPVAESGFTGRWLRLPTLQVREELPLHAQVFLLWFELVLTRRSATNTAIAAGAGAAAAAAG